jgi:hypothetical protein
MAGQHRLLAERLPTLRQRDTIASLFDLDAVAARLNSLPPADTLARTTNNGQGDQTAVDMAGSLMRAFRVMAWLEQHG